ncbi:jg6108 [Pararge aegeria aegeria]|uniref:Cell division cycle protein 27 homolog n=1 Tax=Pararge aegeria aegeria TaxID=348720 RepID=A0A8S4RFC5_9NEOP|nr:jg6108 [Pararge aegeria aegeria]
MAKAESATRNNVDCLNVDFMRSLVKQYSELGQWTSAFFWADAAAAAASSGPSATASGDDIWLLASAMLARGELHRAAHAVTSRQLHRRHLLCLGVAMRAYIASKEPNTALSVLDECEPALLEPRSMDQTHNLAPCWAATLDALGHASRALGNPAEALRWHERALALRPAKAGSLAARGLCLALLGRETEAADALHAALARDPDHVVALALLDAIVDRLDAALTEEEIPQFAFPAVDIAAPERASPEASEMSMSFD